MNATFNSSSIAVGDFVIVPSWRSVSVEQVVKVTAKQIRTKGWGINTRRKDVVLIAFPTKEAADDLAALINQAAKVRDAQVRDAQTVFSAAKIAAQTAYSEAEAKLLASAMSTSGQDAERLEAKPASAAPERGDAQ